MLQPARSYDEARAAFRWNVPAAYNIGVDACDRHADARPDATALIFEDEAGAVQRYNNRIPPYPETQQYVSTVLQFYRFYQPSQLAQGARPMRASASADGPRVKMVLGGRRDMP